MRRIYLDYNATTPIAPEVREAMQPFLAEHYGNPSSNHSFGRACAEAINDAREQLAALIGVTSDELYFTGGGTESNNLALKGVFLSDVSFLSGHLVISAIEHPAIAVPAEFLEKHGVAVTRVPCDREGFIDPDAVHDALRPDTQMVSIMLANNEVGSIQPLREIAALCKERGILCHTDAAQAVGKIPVDAKQLGVDMLSIAGHKLYAPKGIGAIYIADHVDLCPLLHGAAHERGIRAGTENTPYIVGIGRAARLGAEHLADEGLVSDYRDRLWDLLRRDLGSAIAAHSDLERCLPNTLSVQFSRIHGYELLAAVPEVCASTGAACHSGASEISATLASMQVPPESAQGTVRLSTGRYTHDDDIERAAKSLSEAYLRLVG